MERHLLGVHELSRRLTCSCTMGRHLPGVHELPRRLTCSCPMEDSNLEYMNYQDVLQIHAPYGKTVTWSIWITKTSYSFLLAMLWGDCNQRCLPDQDGTVTYSLLDSISSSAVRATVFGTCYTTSCFAHYKGFGSLSPTKRWNCDWRREEGAGVDWSTRGAWGSPQRPHCSCKQVQMARNYVAI